MTNKLISDQHDGKSSEATDLSTKITIYDKILVMIAMIIRITVPVFWCEGDDDKVVPDAGDPENLNLEDNTCYTLD